MRSWNLLQIDTPGGSRSPVVLHSNGEARALLISLDAGQELGDHQVKEAAFLAVVDGSVRVQSGVDAVDGSTGTLFAFAPNERRTVSSDEGARILLLLAPWPGEGHYRGQERSAESS